MSDDSAEPKQPDEPKVKVSDRRRFTTEGQTRDPSEIDPSPPGSAAADAATGAATSIPPESPQPQGAAEPATDELSRNRPLPPASFELLVFSLAIQAQMELGLGEPAEGHIPDLDIARHTIDLLAILQQKTKGNLTLEEQRLLENTLTELRFRYVQALDQINKRAKP
jgi:Domain of unknown function (DUF1844)